MSDTQTTQRTQAPASDQPKTVQVDTANALAIAKAVLITNGAPMHHKALVEKAAAMGLNPNNLDLATKIWNDTRKDSEKSEFFFLGKGVFALKTHDAVKEKGKDTDPSAFVPSRARSTNTKALSVDQIKAKITRLETELAAAKQALADKEKEGTAAPAAAPTAAPKPPAAAPTAPAPPKPAAAPAPAKS